MTLRCRGPGFKTVLARKGTCQTVMLKGERQMAEPHRKEVPKEGNPKKKASSPFQPQLLPQIPLYLSPRTYSVVQT